MTKRIVISAFALAVGLGACSESTLPTELNNPNTAPGDSKFGQALSLENGVVVTPSVTDPIGPAGPANPDSTGHYTRHISEGTDKTKYVPIGHEHIKDDHNRSKYKPKGYEHIKEGDDKTKYKPGGWIHYNGERTIDKTKYIPSGYKHIASGPNETRYNSTGTSTTIGDDETPIGDEGVH